MKLRSGMVMRNFFTASDGPLLLRRGRCVSNRNELDFPTAKQINNTYGSFDVMGTDGKLVLSKATGGRSVGCGDFPVGNLMGSTSGALIRREIFFDPKKSSSPVALSNRFGGAIPPTVAMRWL